MVDSDGAKKRAGLARAESMTASERKALASRAAHARWKKVKDSIVVATHEGEWKLGDLRIPCAVLEDGRRIFSERGLSDAFAHVRSGGEYKKRREQPESERLPVFLNQSIAQHLSTTARERLSSPIRYRRSDGFSVPAWGIEAELLPELCDAYLAAREHGQLSTAAGLRKAQAAERLLRALAKVGVVALIDEVTGYQFERDRDELQRLLEKYVSEDFRPWSRKFPGEYYSEIFRLRGMKMADARRKPQWLGHVTNNIVYDRLLPGIRERLVEVNPVLESGHRARKHHQHFTEQTGTEHLQKHIGHVVILMKAAKSWDEFMSLLDRALPKQVQQAALEAAE